MVSWAWSMELSGSVPRLSFLYIRKGLGLTLEEFHIKWTGWGRGELRIENAGGFAADWGMGVSGRERPKDANAFLKDAKLWHPFVFGLKSRVYWRFWAGNERMPRRKFGIL